MKLAIISLLLIFASCGSKSSSKDDVPKAGDTRILAFLITRDSTRVLEALKRRIEVVAAYDSTAGDWKVVTDTNWFFPRFIQIDSMGRILKDSNGRELPSSTPIYLRVPKDSVVWRIENISFDSLIKKR